MSKKSLAAICTALLMSLSMCFGVSAESVTDKKATSSSSSRKPNFYGGCFINLQDREDRVYDEYNSFRKSYVLAEDGSIDCIMMLFEGDIEPPETVIIDETEFTLIEYGNAREKVSTYQTDIITIAYYK